MRILLTYDIDIRHNEVKQAMFDLGYADFIIGENGTTYHLPNTTLFLSRAGATASTAKREMEGVIADLNRGEKPSNIILLERLMAVRFEKFKGIPGSRSTR